MSDELLPEELREIARGQTDTGVNEPCPFCGTKKLITRIGDHIIKNHREELYLAIASYKEE